MEGNCSDSIQRWYFNNRTGLCQSFIYRGCGGNANNFNSTMYCNMACNNISSAGMHMYSIEEKTRKLKAQQQAAGGQQQGGEAANGPNGAVTPPTNFDNPRRVQAAEISPTGEPAIIQNRTVVGGQHQRTRQPVQPGNSPTGRSPRNKRSTEEHRRRHNTDVDETEDTDKSSAASAITAADKKSHHPRRRSKSMKTKKLQQQEHRISDADEPAEERDTRLSGSKETSVSEHETRRSRKGKTGGSILAELLMQMRSTASKLERALATAATVRQSSSTVRRRGGGNHHRRLTTPDEPAMDQEELHTHPGQTKAAAEATGGKMESERSTIHRRVGGGTGHQSADAEKKKDKKKLLDKRLEITLIGGGSLQGKETTKNGKMAAAADGKGHGQEAEKPQQHRRHRKHDDKGEEDAPEEEDADVADVEIVGDTIRSIIFDPSYVFSYRNITDDDMTSLQEMAAQSDVGTIKIVEKHEGETDDDVDDDVLKVDDDDDDDDMTASTPAAPEGEAAASKNEETEKDATPGAAAAAAEAVTPTTSTDGGNAEEKRSVDSALQQPKVGQQQQDKPSA
jgi:hypothetical protein